MESGNIIHAINHKGFPARGRDSTRARGDRERERERKNENENTGRQSAQEFHVKCAIEAAENLENWRKLPTQG